MLTTYRKAVGISLLLVALLIVLALSESSVSLRKGGAFLHRPPIHSVCHHASHFLAVSNIALPRRLFVPELNSIGRDCIRPVLTLVLPLYQSRAPPLIYSLHLR